MGDKISIIIPTFNEGRKVNDLIKALIARNKQHLCEIIVCDSSVSVDHSIVDVRFCDVAKYYKCNGKGRAAQMNEGAALAKGDILMFCHADVLPPTGFDEYIVEAIHHQFEMGFFAYRFDPTNLWLDLNATQNKRDGIFTGGGDQCHFVLKSTFFKLGGYDEKYVIMEDFAFFRKVRKLKIPYKIIQNKAVVSSRKYNKNSYLRVNLANLVAFTMFLIGACPKRIKSFYSKAIRT